MPTSALVLATLVASSNAASLYDLDLEANDLQSGLPVPMSYYRGKALLIVNVASQCGFTDSSYAYLNELHKQYASRGLAVLGFPCNQFGQQEPGEAADIFSFVTRTKGVGFDLFRKVDVNGANAHPLFKFLRGEDGDCRDDDGSCESWAEGGECESNPEFMGGSCRLSCKLCTPSAGVGPPIKWNFESFLVSKAGAMIERFMTGTDLTSAETRETIERALV